MVLNQVRKVIVIGGSTGAIPVLCGILKALPINLDAAIFAVIHTSPQSTYLSEVLDRCGPLSVSMPESGEQIKPGKVYIPKANRHLVIKSGLVFSVMGPRENRHRPAIDMLFRSAARCFRQCVVGVILSGAQDDGSAGALAIKARDGLVMVRIRKRLS